MNLHAVLTEVIPTLASLIEGIGVLIILYGCVKSLYLFIIDRLNLSNNQPKLELAKALAFSLEFKLAAEILKMVIIQTIDEFIVLSAIVILRVVLTVVIHWEIKSTNSEELD